MSNDSPIDRLISLALEEDLSKGDITTQTTVDSGVRGEGVVLAKQDLVVAGLDVAERVCAHLDADIVIQWREENGALVSSGSVLGSVRGPLHSLLAAERTLLNFLQRLSGTATLTRRFVDAVAGLATSIVDTRKTTPGWRALEKAAVVAGGGSNHRVCLGTGVLIKDNHVDAGGGVEDVVTKARALAPEGMAIQVEVRTLAELQSAIEAKADMVLLDNMSIEMLREAVQQARSVGLITEASGGVTLETVRAIAETGVDRISVGALTHSAPSVDISMKVHVR
jgi:nicotinate-nucleotide pyrophosphorylase (carboxylating)